MLPAQAYQELSRGDAEAAAEIAARSRTQARLNIVSTM